MIPYHNVDKKLLVRQGLFVIIILVLLGITITNLTLGHIGVPWGVGGFLVATGIGLILSRMFRIFWHQERKKVISQLDAVGAIFLVIYILIEISRNWFLEHWLHGAALNALGLAILMGLLLGRFLGTTVRIHDVLTENHNSAHEL